MYHHIKICLFTVFLPVFFFGCGGRNLYKKAKFDNSLLRKTYVHSTRTENPDAGNEPVESSSPVTDENTIYLGSETKGLQALDRFSFREKWRLPIVSGTSSPILLHEGTLFFGANDGAFYAVSAEFGRVLWRHETKAPVYGRAKVYQDKIFFVASDDVLYALEAQTGKWLWHYKRTGSYITTVRGNGTPAVDEKSVYVGFSDGYFAAFAIKDGNLSWETQVHRGSKFLDVDAEASLDGSKLFIPSYDGELYCLNKESGKTLWHIEVGGSKKVLLSDNNLYVPSSNGQIVSVNKDSGRINWRFDLDEGTPTELIEHGNYLAFGSSRTYFYAIHKGDGSLAYRHLIGSRSGTFSSLSEQDDSIYFLSNFGNLYQFSWSKSALKNPIALH